MQIKELMKQPFVIDKDMSLFDAAKIMSDKSIGSLIFISKSKPKGLITDKDLLRNFGTDKKISEIMSKKLLTIEENKSIDEALELMRENKLNMIPVVNKDKKLTGIISLIDIALNVDKFDGEFFFD